MVDWYGEMVLSWATWLTEHFLVPLGMEPTVFWSVFWSVAVLVPFAVGSLAAIILVIAVKSKDTQTNHAVIVFTIVLFVVAGITLVLGSSAQDSVKTGVQHGTMDCLDGTTGDDCVLVDATTCETWPVQVQ